MYTQLCDEPITCSHLQGAWDSLRQVMLAGSKGGAAQAEHLDKAHDGVDGAHNVLPQGVLHSGGWGNSWRWRDMGGARVQTKAMAGHSQWTKCIMGFVKVLC